MRLSNTLTSTHLTVATALNVCKTIHIIIPGGHVCVCVLLRCCCAGVCVREQGVEVSGTLRDGLRGAPPTPGAAPPNHSDTADRQGQTED